MPFKSRKQQAYLYAKKPEVAEKFSEETPKSAYKKLPDYVRDKDGLQKISNKYRRKKDG